MFSFFKKNNNEVISENELKAFLSGEVVPIEMVPDEVFSKKILGDGLAIIPQDNVVLAPVSAEISLVMTDSKHACGLRLSNGMELLIHVGLDTVDMNGDGFELFIKEGRKVKAGDPLIKFDPSKIKAAGHSAITIMAITEQATDSKITMLTGMYAKAGETSILSIE
jgi:PTS system trehalose-specific IIC component